MPPRRVALSLVLLCLAGWLAGSRSLRAQNVDDLFNADTVQEIRLFVNSKDLAAVRARYLDNTFYPADVLWRNTRVRNVAVRVRGFGSRNPTKPGLQLDFDEYTTGQQFVGLKSLVLKNLYLDASMIREKVALGLYARMGQPTSRESFGRVYINNVLQGLYGVVEDIDASFLTRVFGDSTGFLYEYHWQFKWTGDYLGDGLEPYKGFFDPRAPHARDADTILYTPIRDLFREINGPDDAVWRDRVEQLIDLKQFISMVAIEVFLVEADGLTGDFGMANFNVYRPSGATRHQIITWDRDHAMWEDVNGSIFLRTADNVLFRRAMRYADLYTFYLDELQRCADLATQDGWLENEVTKQSTLIGAAALEDPRKKFTNDEYDAETQKLAAFARIRPGHVVSEIAKARKANPF